MTIEQMIRPRHRAGFGASRMLRADALAIVDAVRDKRASATEITRVFLDNVRRQNSRFNCFTSITEERALGEAKAVDDAVANGGKLGPLCGVPYAVKNSFDVEGISTLAGSRINSELPPAERNAAAVQRMSEAGAVLVGTLNMEEYAYGFTTENEHYGAVRNPHDTSRIAGGSSGGSAAAVAGGLVPLALGSDTGGSVRLPAALCGVFGIKPTFGRLDRTGCFPLAASFDTVGAFARTVDDLAICYQVMLDDDSNRGSHDATADLLPRRLEDEIADMHIAIADDYFDRYSEDDARKAVAHIARALGATCRVTLPEAERARTAHVVITAAEGGTVHMSNLRARPHDFEPSSRNRLIAGAISPASWYLQAQRFRRWFCDALAQVFKDVDVILAPASPCPATPIGAETMKVRGVDFGPRSYMGMLTQPISLAGLPVITVPLLREGQMPLGVQIIAPPWREDVCFTVARFLERCGAACSGIAMGAVAAETPESAQ
jgi:AtzE family amidohydrolase